MDCYTDFTTHTSTGFQRFLCGSWAGNSPQFVRRREHYSCKTEVRESRSKYSLRFGIFCIIGGDMINRGRICDEYHERVWISNAVINNSDGAGYSAGAILNTRFKGSFDKKGRKHRLVWRHRGNKRKRKKDLAVRSRVLRQREKGRGLTWVDKEAWSRSKSRDLH